MVKDIRPMRNLSRLTKREKVAGDGEEAKEGMGKTAIRYAA
jgi:hypothetical protein